MSDELHEEIRRMFEDERRDFPPPPDLRSRMIRHAVSGRSAGAARRREWVLAIAAAALAAAVVAGLLLGLRSVRPPSQPAGQPPPPAATASPAQSPVPEQSPATQQSPAPGASAVPTAGPASSSAVPRCHTGDLALALGPVSPGAGQRYVTAVLTNRSSHACWTYGYIGMRLVDGTGRPVPTELVRQPSPAPAMVSLAPGGTVYAVLHWTVVQAVDETATPCEPVAASVQVTPPDETTQLVVGWAYGPVCQHGRIDVGALAPGTGPPG
jgi:hypothetical protein